MSCDCEHRGQCKYKLVQETGGHLYEMCKGNMGENARLGLVSIVQDKPVKALVTSSGSSKDNSTYAKTKTKSNIGTFLKKIIAREEPDAMGCGDCAKSVATLNAMTASEAKESIDKTVDEIAQRARDQAPKLWQRIAVRVDQALHLGQTHARIRRWVEEAIQESERQETKAPKVPRKQRKKHRKAKPKRQKKNISLVDGLRGKISTPKIKVAKAPFTGEIIRNLNYHVYPMKNSDIWKRNCDELLKRIDIFNGKKIIGVSFDKGSRAPDEVKKHLGNDFEYVVARNDKTAEMTTFLPMLSLVESLNPNEITFRGHAKGVTRTQSRHNHIHEWTKFLYESNLDYIDVIEKQLESKVFSGSFRRRHRMGRGLWFYAGSFYWFRHQWVFSRDWRDVQTDVRWGCENWPGVICDIKETRCTAVDNCDHPYGKKKWEAIAKKYTAWRDSQ